MARHANHQEMVDFFRVSLSREHPQAEFANICMSCLGVFSKLRKQTYERECRMCIQPFNVVTWSDSNHPDDENARKATEICLSCSKLHLVCQCCGSTPLLNDRDSYIKHLVILEYQEQLDAIIRRRQENARLGRVVYGSRDRLCRSAALPNDFTR